MSLNLSPFWRRWKSTCQPKISTNLLVSSCEIPASSMVSDRLDWIMPDTVFSTVMTKRLQTSARTESSKLRTMYSMGLGSYTRNLAELIESVWQTRVYLLSGAILRTSNTLRESCDTWWMMRAGTLY